MHIIKEDENQLEFVVYPTIYFLLVLIALLLIFIQTLTHPPVSEINTVSSILNIRLSASQNYFVGMVVTVAGLLYVLSILVASILIPIRVTINNKSKTIVYRYLAYAPIKAIGETGYIITKEISIPDLVTLQYSNNIPEVPITPSHTSPHAIGKYCFILHDAKTVTIYVGVFSQFPHRAAFKKISEYIKIPYVIESEVSTSHSVVNTHSHLIRVLLFILLGLILILVLFVGSIFLVIFISQGK